jgi:hypothetical protein
MSGVVRFVNAVECGAEPTSLKISFGETVCVDEAPVLIAVKLETVGSHEKSWESKPAPKLASRLSKDVSKSGAFVRGMLGILRGLEGLPFMVAGRVG